MRYWTGLYPENTREVIEEGVELMLHTAVRLLGKRAKRPGPVLAIEDKVSTSDEDDTV
jgi:hypothetical protein